MNIPQYLFPVLVVVVVFALFAWIMTYVKYHAAKRNNNTAYQTFPKILFGEDAITIGSHGMIRVTSKKRNLFKRDIDFVFPSMAKCPDITPQLVKYIWDEAVNGGYFPHAVISFKEEEKQIDIPVVTEIAEEPVVIRQNVRGIVVPNTDTVSINPSFANS